MTLNGNETVRVVGTQANGQPSGEDYPATTTSVVNFAGSGVCSAALTKTSDTTLAAVSGLSVTLVAGATYIFSVYLSVTNGAIGGLKVAFGGTATATQISADAWAYNTTTTAAQGNIVALSSSALAYTGSVTAAEITGSIVVNAGGTFIVEAAQNASNATPTVINVGSYLQIQRVA